MASHRKPEPKNHKRHYETPFYASPLEPESPRKHPTQVDKTGSAAIFSALSCFWFEARAKLYSMLQFCSNIIIIEPDKTGHQNIT